MARSSTSPYHNLMDRLLLNQSEQRGAEPLARAVDAQVGVALPLGRLFLARRSGGPEQTLLDIYCRFVQQLGRVLDLPPVSSLHCAR